MTIGHRVRFRSTVIALCCLVFLVALPAYPSGFQLMSQGARAMGMGLAFTAVADDPSAIFYNPAGLGFQKHFEVEVGSSFLTKIKGDFEGSNPYPGVGTTEKEHKTTFVLPTLYAVIPMTSQLNFGVGVFSPYGLGFRWDNAETFTGRFIAQNVMIQSADINPVISYQLTPQIAVAAGADYRLSGVMLEKNQPSPSVDPFTNSVVDIAHVRLKSELTDNHGWGWNAGLLIKPAPEFSIGAAYRSKITVDYSGTATFQQRLTGNSQYDFLVSQQLPQGAQGVSTKITFPESLNLGIAFGMSGFTISGEADWTKWSRFNELLITFDPASGVPPLDRHTNWTNSWAYRGGIEYKFAKTWAVRAGYYYDKTPQPVEDAGPILADNNRNGYTLGFGYGTDRWGVDLSDLYLKVKARDTTGHSNDNFFGTYKETVNVVAFDVRFSF